MGWATALFLGRMGLGASVRVVETGGDSLLCSSTSRSAGGIRHQFTNEENVRMSLFGTHFLRSLQSIGPATDCQFHERGYLFLAGSAAGAETLRQSNLVQRQCGAQVALLNPSELSRRWPFLHLDDILLAGFGEQGEGWLDPHLLRSSMRQLAMDLGVQQVKATVARGILQRNHVTGVELDSGQVLPCDAVVNALGASCASFMESMDPMFYLPVRRRKRTIFYFECRQPLPNMPMIINTDGTYVRPEGSGYIAGGAESAGPEPDVEAGDFDPAEHLWEERLWESLASRVPAFESVKVQSVWAGNHVYFLSSKKTKNTSFHRLLHHRALRVQHGRSKRHHWAHSFSG